MKLVFFKLEHINFDSHKYHFYSLFGDRSRWQYLGDRFDKIDDDSKKYTEKVSRKRSTDKPIIISS